MADQQPKKWELRQGTVFRLTDYPQIAPWLALCALHETVAAFKILPTREQRLDPAVRRRLLPRLSEDEALRLVWGQGQIEKIGEIALPIDAGKLCAGVLDTTELEQDPDLKGVGKMVVNALCAYVVREGLAAFMESEVRTVQGISQHTTAERARVRAVEARGTETLDPAEVGTWLLPEKQQ